MKKASLAALIAAMVLWSACAGRGRSFEPELNQPVVGSFVDGAAEYDGRLQVIAFNIERGLYWPDVAAYVESRRAELPATVLLLSELDRNHSRTGDIFVAEELARALGMNFVYVTEFIEYNDETPETPGDHGNAILSPFPLEDISVVRHPVVFDWEKAGQLQGEPRHGARVSIGANVVLPSGARVRVYTVHLESNAETVGKWVQLRQVVQDADRYPLPTAIGGDFNELPGGLLFWNLPLHRFQNAFGADLAPTGGCRAGTDRARCLIKIDWIIQRGLHLLDRSVDYPLTHEHGVISDHVPVRAVFEVE